MKIKVSEAKRALTTAVKGMLIRDEKTNQYAVSTMYRMPIYLEGAPGIGKTELCKQAADELGIGYVSYSLVHHTKNSLLGLPVIKEMPDGRKYTVYTMSEMLAAVYAQVNEGNNQGILMLDEVNCCSETITPVLLGFLQTKKLGEFMLPDGWVIVACGNPSEFNKSVRSFDMATIDRVRKIEIAIDTEDYLEYAKKAGVHSLVIDYLTINSNDGYRIANERGKDTECVTYRGWSNLSEGIKAYEKIGALDEVNVPFILQFIKSEDISRRFFEYYKKMCKSLNAADIQDMYRGIMDEVRFKNILAKSYPEKYKFAEMIIGYAINHSIDTKEAMGDTDDKWGQYVENGITNVYSALSRIDDSGSFCHMFTESINNTSGMMAIMRSVNVAQYNADIMKIYDVA